MNLVYMIQKKQKKNAAKLTSKEENNDNGVDDGKPVNVEIGHFQIDVPTRRPPHLTPSELNLITPHYVRHTCQTHTRN